MIKNNATVDKSKDPLEFQWFQRVFAMVLARHLGLEPRTDRLLVSLVIPMLTAIFGLNLTTF